MTVQRFPHTYSVSASEQADQRIPVSSPGLLSFDTAAPEEFGGPGDLWSPETLLVASVANCYILTFRAITRAAGFEWKALDCSVEGVLDKVDRELRFVEFIVRPHLVINDEAELEKAQQLLLKAEQQCLVAKSLNADFQLKSRIQISP